MSETKKADGNTGCQPFIYKSNLILLPTTIVSVIALPSVLHYVRTRTNEA